MGMRGRGDARPMSGDPTRRLAFLAILAMTAAWGSTFFMIKDVVTRIPVIDLLAWRFGIAALAMTVLAGRRLRMSRTTLRNGVLLGLLYGGAQILQTYGLSMTDASVSAFITGLYVVATPLLAALILRTRIGKLTWLAAALATLGLGVLSLRGFAIGPGELLTLASAIVYALHIIAMSKVSRAGEEVALTVVQMVVIALVCFAVALPGGVQLPHRSTDWLIVVYLAVVAGALAMFLQTWAQARIPPTQAAVVMSMEPVWAAVFAVAFGGESITGRMIIGGVAILAAMYLVEIGPGVLERRRRRRRSRGTKPLAQVAATSSPEAGPAVSREGERGTG